MGDRVRHAGAASASRLRLRDAEASTIKIRRTGNVSSKTIVEIGAELRHSAATSARRSWQRNQARRPMRHRPRHEDRPSTLSSSALSESPGRRSLIGKPLTPSPARLGMQGHIIDGYKVTIGGQGGSDYESLDETRRYSARTARPASTARPSITLSPNSPSSSAE